MPRSARHPGTWHVRVLPLRGALGARLPSEPSVGLLDITILVWDTKPVGHRVCGSGGRWDQSTNSSRLAK